MLSFWNTFFHSIICLGGLSTFIHRSTSVFYMMHKCGYVTGDLDIPILMEFSVMKFWPSNLVCWIFFYSWLTVERAPLQLLLPLLWWERWSICISYITLWWFCQVCSGLSDQSTIQEKYLRELVRKNFFSYLG